MTITLLAPDGVEITAQQWRQAQAATHGGGSGRRLGGRSGFRVDTPANVLTATSTTWTLGPVAAMIDPKSTTHQGMYGWSSDANITGGIDPADETNARKDVIYIDLWDDTAGDGTGLVEANVKYLAGTPSSIPTAPLHTGFLVGTISVPKFGGGSPTVVLNPARYVAAGGALPVFSQDERDALPDKYDGLRVQRLDIGGRPVETWDGADWVGALRHAEYSNTQNGVPSGAPFGPSVMSLDVGRSRYPGHVSNTTNDLFTANQAGVYSFHWYLVWGIPNVAATVFFAIDRAGVRVAAEQKPSAYEHSFSVPNVYLNAGDTLKLIFIQNTGSAANITHRVRITKQP
jgi:hypothetical protein